jgi:hypothetical protein
VWTEHRTVFAPFQDAFQAPSSEQSSASLGTGAGRLERQLRQNAGKEREMRSRLIVALGVLVSAAIAAPVALADNNATGSIGSVQVSNTTAAPSASATAGSVSASVSVPTSVGGSGNNTASNSVGTAQAGGGNTASNSVGAVQVSGANTAPSGSATVAGNQVNAAAPTSIGGSGSNTSSNSIGTAQVGGANSSNGSIGGAQLGGTRTSPAVGASIVGLAASAALTAALAGSGNNATDSIGTVQLGGGNASDGSALVVQSGALAIDPAVDAGDTSASGPVNIGGSGGGNTASNSIGVAQIGGSGTASPAGGNSGVLGAAAIVPAGQPVGTKSNRSALQMPTVLGARNALDRPGAANQLPFTGLSLLLALLLGLGVLSAGAGLRAARVPA